MVIKVVFICRTQKKLLFHQETEKMILILFLKVSLGMIYNFCYNRN